jgi:hypothetical protein
MSGGYWMDRLFTGAFSAIGAILVTSDSRTLLVMGVVVLSWVLGNVIRVELRSYESRALTREDEAR